MPHGVAMCKNAGCASREGCYRFIAEPAAQQFYGHFTVPKDEDKCVYYIDAQENPPFLKPEEEK